jgi:hypothetical protein
MRLGVLVPFGRLKLIDWQQLAARMKGRVVDASAKQIPSERPATWARVMRLLGSHEWQPAKLPLRTLRAAKLRLFRSFKLLGILKSAPMVPEADTPAPRRFVRFFSPN